MSLNKSKDWPLKMKSALTKKKGVDRITKVLSGDWLGTWAQLTPRVWQEGGSGIPSHPGCGFITNAALRGHPGSPVHLGTTFTL